MLSKWRFNNESHKCRACGRRLQPGLYDPASALCHNCMHRLTISKKIRQRGAGPVKFSVNSTFITQNIPASPGQMDPLVYLNSISDDLRTTFNDALSMQGAIKFYLTVNINMTRSVEVGYHRDVGHFCSIPIVLYKDSNINEQLGKADRK